MGQTISVEHRGAVAVVKLERDITNALNLECVTALGEVIQDVKIDSGVRGVVLASANDKIFSLGFDIPWLYDLGQDDFEHFFTTFNRVCLALYTLPKPTVAAMTGHTIAGGCILALCCDYRFIAEGRKLMTLNEIRLGVPVPYLPDCILHQLLGMKGAREVLETGDFYPPEKLLQMGMVDEVLPLNEVLPRALEKAETLGAMPPKAFAAIKRNRVEMIEARVLEHGEEKARAFVECWYSEDARRLLREAMKKF
jgi:3,2-trans-enoyl-CoA isomerase